MPLPNKTLFAGAAILATGIIVALAPLPHRNPQPPRSTATPVILNPEITLQGKIRPQHVTGVAAPLTGLVEAVLVDIGQEVFQGEVLARVGAQTLESARELAASDLEHAQQQGEKAEAAVNSARMEESRAEADAQRSAAALDRAQRVYERQHLLVTQGATPRLTFEKAEADYQAAVKESGIMETAARAARASRDQVQNALRDLTAKKNIVQDREQQLEEAQTNLSAAEIHSPVDGTVVARNAEIGKPANESGDEFFQIATDLYALEVSLDPKPEDLKRIHPGQQALVLILDLQSQALPGAVREIKGSQVIVDFEANLPGIKPGMLADVRLKPE